MIGKLK